MKIVNAAVWSAASLVLLGVLGCDLYVGGRSRHEPVYVQGQPRYVQPETVYVEPAPQYIIVREAPPPIRIERRPAQPSADVVWIDGYWNWSNQTYSWEGGHYARPPQPDVIWIAARYDSDPKGVRYTPGQWSPGPGNGRGRGRGN